VATSRRHFCDDGCNCNVALKSSKLRQLCFLVARIHMVTEDCTVVNNDRDRNALTVPKAAISTGAARASLSCSICDGVHGYQDALSSPSLWSPGFRRGLIVVASRVIRREERQRLR
jgi:hypothetical protein